MAYWWLNLEREFVFVGDAGDTEAKGRSRRRGVEVAAELEILEWLFWQGDARRTRAASSTNGDKIPQAVRFIADTGLVGAPPLGPLGAS